MSTGVQANAVSISWAVSQAFSLHMTKILCQMSAYHKWVGWDRATGRQFRMGFQGRCLGKFVLGNSRPVPGARRWKRRIWKCNSVSLGRGECRLGNLSDKFTLNFKKEERRNMLIPEFHLIAPGYYFSFFFSPREILFSQSLTRREFKRDN